ncbi:peptidoglycan DD-metalloendopeptidase family protein [Cesiribacter andamanensis]|uniref:Glycyl-glycine endopeptidase lytM n=1 Tax=Cesiribacter andamanensis AMV16 TaxID=1279009 RepID=M7NC66_9BACT|nr:peptidoglycan DD-metalloendopeptidase family protein [Cesiribacter andamanensis]EMR04751.1 Glycyl-glycine endopeptidase lytM precursor [Cesiribacter andamanensis AMV16]
MKLLHSLIVLLALVLVGCNGSIKQALTSIPPYEQYIRSLEKAGLDQTPMAQRWLAAGQRVFTDSVQIRLPLSEAGYFAAATPDARSYRFDGREGQVLTVDGALTAEPTTTLYLDLFVWQNNRWDRQASEVVQADSSLQFNYEFRQDQHCLLRLQPQLLTDVYYTLSLNLTPVLINPVSGASNRSIGSFYGADRDGGQRSHEGVDIFAARGTPVVAPTSGVVSRVGTNRLGGKVIWMQDIKRGHTYYFAHLDSQLVASGRRVAQGDTLGLVGNTGNARSTPPHLHFGIYQRGSKDPINYIRTLEAAVEASPLDTSYQAQAYKITATQLNLRSGPGTAEAVLDQLPRDTFVQIIAQAGDWYRISLPDQRQGFVPKRYVSAATSGQPLQVAAPSLLRSQATPQAVPVRELEENSSVEVLAHFGEFAFVRTAQGVVGWLAR